MSLPREFMKCYRIILPANRHPIELHGIDPRSGPRGNDSFESICCDLGGAQGEAWTVALINVKSRQTQLHHRRSAEGRSEGDGHAKGSGFVWFADFCIQIPVRGEDANADSGGQNFPGNGGRIHDEIRVRFHSSSSKRADATQHLFQCHEIGHEIAQLPLGQQCSHRRHRAHRRGHVMNVGGGDGFRSGPFENIQ